MPPIYPLLPLFGQERMKRALYLELQLTPA